ncbi:MAG: efflux RND transporter periplasmic adaptor subunit [Candidatus Eisenbacteria bacterium]|nr:efflux RND transporter periplasmic adaptor subunit [Candidatus Eisenbacteria bacterium]
MSADRHSGSERIIRSAARRAPLLLLPLSLWLSGCGSGGDAGAGDGTPEVPRNVRTLRVQAGELEEYLRISGPLQAMRGTDISAEEGGVVAAIPRGKGASVARDEVLILLDRDLLEAERDAARARRDLSAFNQEQTRALYEANSASRIELLTTETEHRSAQAAARIAELRYERAAIEAPFNGVVAERYVELGQYVSPGMPVARIVDPHVLKLVGHLTEREIGYVREGEPAQVSCEESPDPRSAYVHWVGIEADPLTGKFPIEIHVDNAQRSLHAGVIGCARVLKVRHEDVIRIPRDAVVQRPSGPVAFVVEAARARVRRLTLGPDQGLMVVVENGLAHGDELIVRGQREVHDGSAVLVQEKATAADGTMPDDPGVVSAAQSAGHGAR